MQRTEGSTCTDPTTATGLRVYPPGQHAALFVPARTDPSLQVQGLVAG